MHSQYSHHKHLSLPDELSSKVILSSVHPFSIISRYYALHRISSWHSRQLLSPAAGRELDLDLLFDEAQKQRVVYILIIGFLAFGNVLKKKLSHDTG